MPYKLQPLIHYIETYKDYPLIACVLDTYDIYKAADYVTSGKRKDKIESEDYSTFVIRPDSGKPREVLYKIQKIMEKNNVRIKKSSLNLNN